MKVIRAGVLGFCMGVRRAVSIAAEEANEGSRVFTLGPLVHNPVVLNDLKKIGIEILTEPFGDLSGCSVIIRAHGVSPAKEEELRNKGAFIIDATCPKVKKSQASAKRLAREGYNLFLAGKKTHAEILGILGYAEKAPFCKVIESAEEAEKIFESVYKVISKTALLGQTTISCEEYHKIAGIIKRHFPDLNVIDTICQAATERQSALRELLGKAEAVIVAGGKESANTRQLFSIAEESGKPCCLIETAAGIPPSFFDYETVGISAGASTPDSVIDQIEKALLAAKANKY